MTINTRKQIQLILADLDATFRTEMLASRKDEELFEKKYTLSDWIYCLYANDEKTENLNHDYKDSLEWLIEQFYETKENVAFWDKNWTFDESSKVYAKRYGKFYVSKSGEYKLVSAEDFISSTESDKQKRYVDLRIKRFEISDNTWFYFRGNKYLGTAFLTRLYFNFNYDFENVVSFSKALCHELNQWGVPFEYKFATKKSQRFDNGVLYTAREHYFVVFYLVCKLTADKQYSRLFGSETLSFTKKTPLKGISFGEEPPIRNSSFGRYRADIMADIYIDYYRNSQPQKLGNYFFRKLSETGFNIDDFFRNPNSHYPYDFSILNRNQLLLKKKSSTQQNSHLSWAKNVGKLLCKQAIIIQQENKTNCHWLSNIEDEHSQTDYRLTDDSFEEGRLGIIYFLAKLYTFFREEYLFKVICEAVLNDIRTDRDFQEEIIPATIIQEIKLLLQLAYSRKVETVTNETINHPLVDEIINIISGTKNYTAVNNDAPQPIIKKGYAAIGLILLAIYQNDIQTIDFYQNYYNKEALLKLINHVKF